MVREVCDLYEMEAARLPDTELMSLVNKVRRQCDLTTSVLSCDHQEQLRQCSIVEALMEQAAAE